MLADVEALTALNTAELSLGDSFELLYSNVARNEYLVSTLFEYGALDADVFDICLSYEMPLLRLIVFEFIGRTLGEYVDVFTKYGKFWSILQNSSSSGECHPKRLVVWNKQKKKKNNRNSMVIHFSF